MKFMHIADVHLGANPDAGKAYSEHRGREIWDSLERAISMCEQEEVDILLIAGDLFHRQPLLRELKEVNYLFSTLTRTRVVLIAGNHDYIKHNSYYKSFPWHGNVYPLFGERMEKVIFPELKLAVYGLSYYNKMITEPLYDHAEAPRRLRYEILLAHGGDEKHIPIKRSKLSELGYDYVALGHLHKPEVVVDNHVIYAGALEPIDKNDTGEHGLVMGEILDNKVMAELLYCAQRRYIHSDINVDQSMTSGALKQAIKEHIEQQGEENLYKVTLQGFRDPDILFDLEDMDTMGNLIEIVDETSPAYDFDKLYDKNKNNLLGKFIKELMDSDKDSVRYLALYEGVQALLATKKGG